jgi:ABC-type amino acid transport system permease subunit
VSTAGFFDRLNSGGSPIIAGGSPELLAEVKALRAEVARLTAVTAAGAEHVREGVDGVAARQADTAREVKLQRSRI